MSVNQIMSTLLHSRAEVVVPKLEGKNLVEALQIASGNTAGLPGRVTDRRLLARIQRCAGDPRLVQRVQPCQSLHSLIAIP